MKSALASLSLNGDDTRHYRLPHDGSRSLVFVFRSDWQLGAMAYSAIDEDFEPGSSQTCVRLDFWADDEWTDVVEVGAEFTIWYGGDVGSGVIDDVL